MLHVVSVSGGKDSTALYLWAIEQFGPDGFRAVFADTGSEAPVTLNYIRNLPALASGPEITWLKKDYSKRLAKKGLPVSGIPFTDMLRAHQVMPNHRMQFCSVELKIHPIAEWLDTIRGDEECAMYVGIRAEESPKRALMKEVEWSELFDCEVRRPLLRWTIEQVFAMHNKFGVEPNPLYAIGFSRVGCFPCIHSNKSDLSLLPDWAWERARAWEKDAGNGFFRPSKTGDIMCSLDDVRAWAKQKGVAVREPEVIPTCLSHWVCE